MPPTVPQSLLPCLAQMLEKDVDERLTAEDALSTLLRAFPKFLTADRIQLIQQIQLEMDDQFFKDVETIGHEEADRRRLQAFVENHGERFREMGYSQEVIEQIYRSGDYKQWGI